MKFYRTNFEKFEIMCLQETHGRKKEITRTVQSLGFKKGVFSLANSQAKGVAILWRNPIEGGENTWTDNEGRVAIAHLQLENQPIVVVGIYAPNLNATILAREEYVTYLISVRHMIERAKQKANTDNIIMMGDFNLIMNAELDSYSKNPKVYEVPKEELVDLTDNFALQDCFRQLNGDTKAYTFSRHNENPTKGIYNRLDYIYASDAILRVAKDCNHIAVGKTDHLAVQLILNEKKERKKLGLWRHNDSYNKDVEFITLMSTVIKEAQECSFELKVWSRLSIYILKLKLWSGLQSFTMELKMSMRKNTIWH